MTGRSKRPEKSGIGACALGVRAHSGWAAYVVLSGRLDAPAIVARGRFELCDPSIRGSKQPFHEAEPMDGGAAERFIARCSASTAALADAALDRLVREAPDVRACGVLAASGRTLPELRVILASHALIHSAEGEFYRSAVAEACLRRSIAVHRIVEREIDQAAEGLPGSAASRRARLDAFGRSVGTPWRQDEKLSALAAWLALAAKPSAGTAGRRHP